jgi:hypothetical protein
MIFVEDWGAGYGSPYIVDAGFEESADQVGRLVEDGDDLRLHTPPKPSDDKTIAFVDGIRRAEAWLYRSETTGESARGLAGAFAVGAVVVGRGAPAVYAHEHVEHLAIWGSGFAGPTLIAPGGWTWASRSVPSSDPDAPLEHFQRAMRTQEGLLASQLAEKEEGLVIIDGPLDYVTARQALVIGHVKTHRRAFLPAEIHARIPALRLAERTSVFALEDRYSCYLRIAETGPFAGPWSGIVRLHLPGHAGLDTAVALADAATCRLPTFAGVPHRDPRAPQNLQPIGALESHLRRLMGDVGLATRAVRDAVRAQRAA